MGISNEDDINIYIQKEIKFIDPNLLRLRLILYNDYIIILDAVFNRIIKMYKYEKKYYYQDDVAIINNYGNNLLYQMPEYFDFITNINYIIVDNHNDDQNYGIKETFSDSMYYDYQIHEFIHYDQIINRFEKHDIDKEINKIINNKNYMVNLETIYIGINKSKNYDKKMESFLKHIN